MPKLIAVIENLDDSYGGPAVSLPGLLNALVEEHNVDAKIISIRLKNIERNSALQSSSVEWDNSGKLFMFRKVMFSFGFSFRLIKSVSADSVVYINNLWNYVSFFSYVVARIAGAKIVYAPRGSLYTWSLSQRGFVKRMALTLFQKRFLRNADIVHVTAEDERAAVSALGVDARKIKSVPHGTEIPNDSMLRAIDHERAISINGYELPDKYFLFLSRLHKKKGIDILLDIWDEIKSAYPDWRLVVAGPDYGGYLASGALSNVDYIGEVSGNDKWSVLRRSQFMVLPSFTENFGVVIAESLAAGVPVITTDQTPWPVLNDSGCGAWIPQQQFKETLCHYLEKDSGDLGEMGVVGRSLIKTTYSWSGRAKDFYSTIYRPLIVNE